MKRSRDRETLNPSWGFTPDPKPLKIWKLRNFITFAEHMTSRFNARGFRGLPEKGESWTSRIKPGTMLNVTLK